VIWGGAKEAGSREKRDNQLEDFGLPTQKRLNTYQGKTALKCIIDRKAK